MNLLQDYDSSSDEEGSVAPLSPSRAEDHSTATPSVVTRPSSLDPMDLHEPAKANRPIMSSLAMLGTGHLPKEQVFQGIGLWPLSITFQVDLSQVNGAQDTINKLVQRAQSILPQVEAVTPDHYHISLARTGALAYHFIQPFVDCVKEEVGNTSTPPFVITLDRITSLVNETKSRAFLALGLSDDSFESASPILSAVNRAMQRYGKQEYYDNPQLHLSIATCESPWEYGQVETLFQPLLGPLLPDIAWVVDTIRLDLGYGQRVYHIPLATT